jgi:hypothetical protein
VTRRNLILVHRGPDYERDFDEIAAKVTALDEDITVYHRPSSLDAELPAGVWEHPTLTVALVQRFRVPIARGPVLRNSTIGKLAQQEIFRRHGIATPPSLPFRFGMKLDPILFGNFVVLKPLNLRLTSHGDGVMLFRRQRAEGLREAELPAHHPLRRLRSDFLVQRYVHTGADIRWNRVSSLFSRPLYAIHSMSRQPKLDLSDPDEAIENADITNGRDGDRIQQFSAQPDILALARNVHDALPHIPLLGIDILREQRTGKLFVLEANPGGNTWHFSSRSGWEWRQAMARDASADPKVIDETARHRLISQFGAFDVAAQVLAEKTAELAA